MFFNISLTPQLEFQFKFETCKNNTYFAYFLHKIWSRIEIYFKKRLIFLITV